MSRIRRNAIRIQNPISGGVAYTTRKAALGFIRRGLAVSIAPDAIRFLEQERRITSGSTRDGTQGGFWWRRGETGGMVQVLGSTVEQCQRDPSRGQTAVQ